MNTINDKIIRDLPATEALNYLNITKKTLYTISAESELELYVSSKNLYVNIKSLLAYLSNRHYETSGLDCDIYNNLKTLQLKCSKNAIPTTIIEVKSILESNAYKNFWWKYEKTIPEANRVKLNPHIDAPNAYNPNLKIVSSRLYQLPALVSIKDLSDKIGVNRRTLSNYCELGKLTHFRVGNKIMFNECEINYSELEHLINNQNRRKKSKSDNSGTYVELEKILTIDDLVSEVFISTFSGDVNHRSLMLIADKIAATEKSMSIKDIDEDSYRIIINKSNVAISRYKRKFIKSLVLTKKQVEAINEKITLLKYFKSKIEYEAISGKNDSILNIYNDEFNQIKVDLIDIIVNKKHSLAG